LSLKFTVFETFAFKKNRDLETRVKGFEVIEMVPFDRSYMTSFIHSFILFHRTQVT